MERQSLLGRRSLLPSLPMRMLPVLLLGALLAPGMESAPIPGHRHISQSVKHLKISVHPTAASVHISSEEHDNQKGSDGLSSLEEAENKLDALVNLLQVVEKNIPKVPAQPPMEPHTSGTDTSHVAPSASGGGETASKSFPPKKKDATITAENPNAEGHHRDINLSVAVYSTTVTSEEPVLNDISTKPAQLSMETVATLWKKFKPEKKEVKVTASTTKTPTTTAFWKVRNDTVATIVLHSDTTTTEENTTPEVLKQDMSASVDVYSTSSISEDQVLVENKAVAAVKEKSFDQLTSRALATLVKSLKSVKTIDLKIHTPIVQAQPQSNDRKPTDIPEHKLAGAGILDLINALIKIIRRAPGDIKDDPDLHSNLEKAEGYLKDALELVVSAKSRLAKIIKMEREKIAKVTTTSSPPDSVGLLAVTVQAEASTADLVALKLAKVQKEMEKLKALVNLLYRFTPRLTSYVQNASNKKAAEDIVNKAMAVLKAVKSVFCGDPDGRSQQVLKELVEKKQQLVRPARKRRVS